MLRYFRINDPYRLFSLLILLVLASLPLLIDLPAMTLQELKGMVLGEVMGEKLLYVEIIDSTAPLMAVTDGLLDFLFGRSLMARHILALIVIFFQASYFGILLINNKAYNENNYVPALIFGFLCFFSFDLLAITPELFASTLLLLALNNLFKEIEFRVDRDSIVLNLGFFLGMSSLFVFSYTVFLIGTVFILIIFARATIRKILLLFFGYGLVHGILMIVYYCYGQTDALWSHFYVANVTQLSSGIVSMKSILTLGIVPLIYFVISLFMLTREARFTKYQSQLFQVIFLWLGIAMLQTWLTAGRTPHSFLTFIPPIAYFISHYLLLIRRKFIAETMLWLLIIGLISVNILSRHKVFDQIDYSAMFPSESIYEKTIVGRKVMIVGDDISLLKQNKLAGYFLDWELSSKYFDGPDYYENIIKINKAVAEDVPDVIIDEAGKMEPFIERIPMIKSHYRKDNGIYWRR
ncbi:MAG: hypothetical protein HOP08_09765 [Cyclobacteriaceae bacterium]|nr:hypothetical protein [Cyclobacteriaceae bacterium]